MERTVSLYKPPAGEAEEVIVPKTVFLMIDGEGTPEASGDFQAAIQSLYGVCYGIKFTRKKAGGQDFKINPLEGLWWMNDEGSFDHIRPQDWRWTLMIALPEDVEKPEVDAARETLMKKKPHLPVGSIRLEEFDEGKSVQIMHVGPYDQEERSISKMDEFAARNGYKFRGRHHEIYLGDPRRAKPERLRTILRHPVA